MKTLSLRERKKNNITSNTDGRRQKMFLQRYSADAWKQLDQNGYRTNEYFRSLNTWERSLRFWNDVNKACLSKVSEKDCRLCTENPATDDMVCVRNTIRRKQTTPFSSVGIGIRNRGQTLKAGKQHHRCSCGQRLIIPIDYCSCGQCLIIPIDGCDHSEWISQHSLTGSGQW